MNTEASEPSPIEAEAPAEAESPPPESEKPKHKKEWVSAVAVAEMFGVTSQTIRIWIRKNKLVGKKKKNGRWYVTRDSYLALAEKMYGSE